MKNSYFVNYENGSAKMQTYRAANAVVTDLEDIQRALSENSEECLSASVDQNFNYDEDLKIATFSGINYSAEKGFDICKNEEAHNVESAEAGMQTFGLFDDLTVDIA